jgi:ubiquinone/menaquinone biosynthesis C-methylase UbiE
MNETGHYPIERRAGEIERLHTQAAAMAPDCAIMLERIGVGPGWKCLDLGCGPGGITGLLSVLVGRTGHVVGLDADPVFIGEARRRAAPNTEFIAGNAYSAGLQGGSFDLVHMRFVASTAGEPEALLKEAKRLTRPSGVVALQEPDMATLNCFPAHPAFDQLKAALEGAFTSVGADIRLARRLFSLARAAGLADVEYRTFMLGVRSGDPMTDYLPSTVESLRGTIVSKGLKAAKDLDTALAECRAHLRNPDVVFTMYAVAQVWGRSSRG